MLLLWIRLRIPAGLNLPIGLVRSTYTSSLSPGTLNLASQTWTSLLVVASIYFTYVINFFKVFRWMMNVLVCCKHLQQPTFLYLDCDLKVDSIILHCSYPYTLMIVFYVVSVVIMSAWTFCLNCWWLLEWVPHFYLNLWRRMIVCN